MHLPWECNWRDQFGPTHGRMIACVPHTMLRVTATAALPGGLNLRQQGHSRPLRYCQAPKDRLWKNGRLCLAQPAMQGDPLGCCAQGKAAGSSTDDMLNAALGPNSSSNSMVGHARYSYHAAYVSTVVIGTCILAFTVGILIWRLFQLKSVGGGRGKGFCQRSQLPHLLGMPSIQIQISVESQ